MKKNRDGFFHLFSPPISRLYGGMPIHYILGENLFFLKLYKEIQQDYYGQKFTINFNFKPECFQLQKNLENRKLLSSLQDFPKKFLSISFGAEVNIIDCEGCSRTPNANLGRKV